MRDTAPTITILICNYNYGRFLGEAIDSALTQTSPAAQIIVADDGSTDNSREVLSRYLNIETILKENGGQASAVRHALPLVRGDILIVLDSDDVLHPTACEVISGLWESDLSLFQYRLVMQSEDKRIVGHYPLQPFLPGNHQSYVLRHGYIPSSPTSGNAFSTAHVREQFEQNHEEDRQFVDGFLIYTAALLGRVKSTDQVLGTYRVHGNNASPSSGATAKKVANQFLTDLKHRIGLAKAARSAKLSDKSAEDFLSPYSWRGALLVNKGYPHNAGRIPYSHSEICARGVRGFVHFPGLSLRQRSLNILGMLLITIGPRALARRILPQ